MTEGLSCRTLAFHSRSPATRGWRSSERALGSACCVHPQGTGAPAASVTLGKAAWKFTKVELLQRAGEAKLPERARVHHARGVSFTAAGPKARAMCHALDASIQPLNRANPQVT